MKPIVFRMKESDKNKLKAVLASKGTNIQQYFFQIAYSLILEKNKETA